MGEVSYSTSNLDECRSIALPIPIVRTTRRSTTKSRRLVWEGEAREQVAWGVGWLPACRASVWVGHTRAQQADLDSRRTEPQDEDDSHSDIVLHDHGLICIWREEWEVSSRESGDGKARTEAGRRGRRAGGKAGN